MYTDKPEYKQLVEAVKIFISSSQGWEIGDALDRIISEMVKAHSYKNGEGLENIKLECKYNTCLVGHYSYVAKYKENGFYYTESRL